MGSAAGTSIDLASGLMQVTSIDLSSNGKYLAGISNEGQALVWNPDDKSTGFKIGSAGKASDPSDSNQMMTGSL
jgi:WD40 repeat protein